MDEFHGHTNESLWAIEKGLDIRPNSRVLTICGSGDQPFALLLAGSQRVLALDTNPRQIDYVRKRIEALRRGDYVNFFPISNEQEEIALVNDLREGRDLSSYWRAIAMTDEGYTPWGCSIRYFLGESRPTWNPRDFAGGFFTPGEKLAKLSGLLNRLTLKQGDIFDLSERDFASFDRVYLSNSHIYGGLGEFAFDTLRKRLESINKALPGTLLYLTHLSTFPISPLDNWELQIELTKKARRLEKPNSWKPFVYKKVA